MRIFFGGFIALLGLLIGSRIVWAEGRIFSSSVPSKILHGAIYYQIYLPDSTLGAPVYTVFLLHSNNGNSLDFFTQGKLQEILDGLIEDEKIPPVAVVAPNGGSSWFLDSPPVRWKEAFFTEFLPKILDSYHLNTIASSLYIGGVEAGAFAALNYLMTHPEAFQGAILLSPYIFEVPDPQTPPYYSTAFMVSGSFSQKLWRQKSYRGLLREYAKHNAEHQIYIGVGDRDVLSSSKESLITVALDLYQTLIVNTSADVRIRILGGFHDWTFWHNALRNAFISLLAAPGVEETEPVIP